MPPLLVVVGKACAIALCLVADESGRQHAWSVNKVGRYVAYSLIVLYQAA